MKLYEVKETNKTGPLTISQFIIFKKELKYFTLLYIDRKLCNRCIYRSKCKNYTLIKLSDPYELPLLTYRELFEMAAQGNCFFPDPATQSAIEIKLKVNKEKINKTIEFDYLYHLVRNNSYPYYENYVVLPEEDENILTDIADYSLFNNYHMITYDDYKLEADKLIRKDKIKNCICFMSILIFVIFTIYIYYIYILFIYTIVIFNRDI